MPKFSKSAIDWVKLEQLVPPEQMPHFMSFRAKNINYFRRVLANPEVPPEIDWEYYNKNVPVAGLVDKFKSAYSSFKVPYPEDKYTEAVSKQWSALEGEIKKYCNEMKIHIDKSTKELERIRSLPKFDDMTLEMYAEMFPEEALDPVNRPTFWPHTPEEQLGYIDPTVKAEH